MGCFKSQNEYCGFVWQMMDVKNHNKMRMLQQNQHYREDTNKYYSINIKYIKMYEILLLVIQLEI